MSNQVNTIKPIALNASKLNVLIIGYGSIGKRKRIKYEAVGANVTTVDLKPSSQADFIQSFSEFYKAHLGVFLGHHLIIISTDDSSENQKIAEVCHKHFKLFNRVDNGEEGLFSDMTFQDSEHFIVAASGKAKSPNVSKFVMKQLEGHIENLADPIKSFIDQNDSHRKMEKG